MTPRLGVVTICRNALPALRRTIDSIRSQRRDTIEHVIVDGASTDGTVDYLRGIETDGTRWVSEPDLGISDAMNKGWRLSRGEWIAHLHAGDAYVPGAVERILAEIEAGGADVLCGWMLKEEPQGDVLCRCDPERLADDMTVNHPATLVRREWLERLGGFDLGLRNAMDYDFFLRAREAGARFRVVPTPLARFAAGGQSERSLWRTLSETHEIRRRHLRSGSSRRRLHLIALWLKGTIRIGLQRAGLHGLVAAYRRHVAWPPKG